MTVTHETEQTDAQALTAMVTADAAAYPLETQPFIRTLLSERFVLEQTYGAQRESWAYLSYHSLVLQHSEPRAASIRTDECLGEMEARLCFNNAHNAAIDYPEYTYVEGFAQAGVLPFPTPHAWLEDEHGDIIDPTWATLLGHEIAIGEPVVYQGIRFTTDFAMQHAIDTGYHSFLSADWMFNCQILRRGFLFDEAGRAHALGGNDA